MVELLYEADQGVPCFLPGCSCALFSLSACRLNWLWLRTKNPRNSVWQPLLKSKRSTLRNSYNFLGEYSMIWFMICYLISYLIGWYRQYFHWKLDTTNGRKYSIKPIPTTSSWTLMAKRMLAWTAKCPKIKWWRRAKRSSTSWSLGRGIDGVIAICKQPAIIINESCHTHFISKQEQGSETGQPDWLQNSAMNSDMISWFLVWIQLWIQYIRHDIIWNSMWYHSSNPWNHFPQPWYHDIVSAWNHDIIYEFRGGNLRYYRVHIIYESKNSSQFCDLTI